MRPITLPTRACLPTGLVGAEQSGSLLTNRLMATVDPVRWGSVIGVSADFRYPWYQWKADDASPKGPARKTAPGRIEAE